MDNNQRENFGETNSFEDKHTPGTMGISITRGEKPMIIAACRGASKLTVTFHDTNTPAQLEAALVRLVVDGLMHQVSNQPSIPEDSTQTTYSD